MTTPAAACRCFKCRKAIAPGKVERIDFETKGKPSETFNLCPRCARRFVTNVIRLERAQHLSEVLKA